MTRPKIAVAAPWPVAARRDGRAVKAWAQCVRWSDVADVEIVCADPAASSVERVPVAVGIVERRVPHGSPSLAQVAALFDLAGPSAAFLPLLLVQTPAYAEVLADACRSAALAIALTPFTYAPARAAARTAVIVAAQGVEWLAADDAFADDARGREARRFIAELERAAVAGADGVLAASDRDRTTFIGCGASPATTEVATAVWWDAAAALPPRADRLACKAKSNLAGRTVALFVGSHTRGNVASVEELVRTAPALPDVFFLIAGGVFDAFKTAATPGNVGFTGALPDQDLAAVLALADVGVEPAAPSALVSAKVQGYVRVGAPVVAREPTASAAGLAPGGYLAWDPASTPLSAAIAAALADPEQADRRRAAAFATLAAAATAPTSTDLVTRLALP